MLYPLGIFKAFCIVRPAASLDNWINWIKRWITLSEYLIGTTTSPPSCENAQITKRSPFVLVEWPRLSRIGPFSWQIRRKPHRLPAPSAPPLFPRGQSLSGNHKLRDRANEWEICDTTCDQLWGDIRAVQPLFANHLYPQSRLGSRQWSYEVGGEIWVWR